MIFQRYLALGSVQKLRLELDTLQVRSKAWTTRARKPVGSCRFSCGSLYKLLSNRHYTGAIVHKDIAYPAQHSAIIEPELFDAVQASLALKAVRAKGRRQPSEHAPFKGLVFSGDKVMTPSFGCDRRKIRYRYYILTGASDTSSADDPPRRIPAAAFEALVTRQLQRFCSAGPVTALDAAKRVQRIELRASSLELVCDAAALQPALHPELALDEIRRRLFDGEKALVDCDDPRRIRISLPIRAQFRGGRTWVEGAVQTVGIKSKGKPNPQIAAALRRAHHVVRRLGASPLRGKMLATASPASSYEARLVHFAFLAPHLQLNLLCGRQAEHLTVDALVAMPPPLSWSAQEAWLGTL